MTNSLCFPDGFLWGAATSAYQVEGSPLADGAGPSIWHRFTRTPCLRADGDTGDVACDHYRRYAEDVALMRDLGLQCLPLQRLVEPRTAGRARPGQRGGASISTAGWSTRCSPPASIRWSRSTTGTCRRRSTTAAAGSTATCADWFADYARCCSAPSTTGSRCGRRSTSRGSSSDGGYLHGVLAPGHRNLFEAPIAIAQPAARPRRGRARPTAPRAATASAWWSTSSRSTRPPRAPRTSPPTARADAYMNRQYLDPVFLGSTRRSCATIFGEAWPDFPAADFAQIRQPIDFLGINYYTRGVTRADAARLPVRASNRAPAPARLHRDRLGGLPAGAHRRAALGAGAATATCRSTSPRTAPPSTIRRRRTARSTTRCGSTTCARHLRAAAPAIEQGVDLRGYFVWSLLDNLEWSLGFAKRFGIVHVDFATQQRTPKASARFYSEVIRTMGAALG